MTPIVHTWEAYTSAARRRAFIESGLGELEQRGLHHVARIEGWPEDAASVLAGVIQRRGGVVRGDGRVRIVAGTLGAFWHAMQALQGRRAPLGGPQLASALGLALATDSGTMVGDADGLETGVDVAETATDPGGSGPLSSGLGAFPIAAGAAAVDMPCGRWLLPFGRRTVIMGILNVTSDSFSDGGRFYRKDDAIAHAREMVQQGADVIDIGGESSRPGALPVDSEEQLARVIPVVEELAGTVTVPMSVDTYRADVAARALEAGADMINDISALRFDPAMAGLIAERGCPIVLMHMQGTPRDMQRNPVYEAVVPDILDFLDDAVARAVQAGIGRDRIIVDPGFGFGKTLAHNMELVHGLSAFRLLGCPVLLGTSRKTSLGDILLHAPPEEREEGTAATVAIGIANGAHMMRVHDVEGMTKVARVADAIVSRRRPARVFLSLGSNMGDSFALLAAARADLAALPGTELVRESPLYRTEPVGNVPQDWFLNQVVELRTYLDPVRLLAETQRIEKRLGRDDVEKRQRWGPRPVDIDMVLYGEETIERPELRVPHPESHRRRFVLQPLVDIDGGVRWLGRTAAEHLAALPAGQPVEPVDGD